MQMTTLFPNICTHQLDARIIQHIHFNLQFQVRLKRVIDSHLRRE